MTELLDATRVDCFVAGETVSLLWIEARSAQARGGSSVKRDKLIRHLTDGGCELLREGGRHSIYRNMTNRQTAPVPRHREIDAVLVLKICKELGVDAPTER